MMDEAVTAEARMKRWYKRRRFWLLVIIVGGGLAGFLYWFPAWAIQRASDKSIDCTNQIYRTGQGNAADCRQGGLLFIPKLLPWKRKEALQIEANIAGRETEDALDLATRRDLDRAARDRGVEAMFAVVRGSPAPDMIHATYHIARSAGAEASLIAHAAELTDGNDQEEALHAAIRAGDRAAAVKIASLPPRGDKPYGFELARGAILCAFGDRAQGLAALEHAEQAWGGTTDFVPAKVALATCDPERKIEVDSVWEPKVAYARVIGGGRASRPGDAYQPEAVVASLASLEQAGVEDIVPYLELVANTELPKPTFKIVSPWSILGTKREWAVSPKWNDAVTARLIAFADAFVPPKPKKKRRGEDDEPPYLPYGKHYIIDEAQLDPRPYLRWGAMIVALDAAVGWVQRGDAAKAQASAAIAAACAGHADTARIEPFAQLLLAPVLHLVGRDTDALATLDALLVRLPSTASDARAMIMIQRAMLLLHAGKPEEAWTALDPIWSSKPDGRTYWNFAWVRAATALMLGRPLEVNLPPPPEKPALQFDHPDMSLAFWWSAATDPARQALFRWRAEGIDPGYFDNIGVLPAQLYVIGKAAGQGDVELWLDVATGAEITPWEALASARAEVARWRGDTAAATAWDGKLAASRALATDDRTAYLLQIALGD